MALNGTALGLTLETKTSALAGGKSNIVVYAEDHDASTQASTLNADSVNQRTFCANAFKMALNGNDIGVTLNTIDAGSPVIASDPSNHNLKVVFDGTDKYEVFLVPDSNGEIKNNQNVGSSTVFACTAFTYGTNYNDTLSNLSTNASTDYNTLSNDHHVCNASNASTLLLDDVQPGFNQLHRLTWYKAGETFTASTDYKIMQLKANTGTKLVGSLELYYGDASNGDQKKYVVSFTNDATTVAITATNIANPPPFRKYYVDVAGSQYQFSNEDGTSFSALTNPITIYKRATYVFQIRSSPNSFANHPFGIKEDSPVTQSATDLFKIQGGSSNTGTLGKFNNIIQNAGEKLTIFTTEIYSGSSSNIKYFCTNHSGMEQAFNLKNNDTEGYNALVDSDRHIEAGQNIRLEVEGEEIKL